MVRRFLIQWDPDQSAPQRQSILFRPAGELFLCLLDAGLKTPFNSFHSATRKRLAIHRSARLALLLEARADQTTIFHSAYKPAKLLYRRIARSLPGFCAGDWFQAGFALQEITSTQWQKN